MPNPSVTTNRLHFEDLEPRRFEELGYQLLHRLYKWERLDHTGVCGNDGGIDIYGITKDGVICAGMSRDWDSSILQYSRN